MAKKKTRLHKTKTEAYLINAKHIGDEPSFNNQEVSRIDLAESYTWYNTMCDREEARGFLVEYLTSKNRNSEVKKLTSISDSYLSTTICWIARMIQRGAILPDTSLTFFETKLKEVLALSTLSTEVVEDSVQRISVFDRMNSKANDIIGDIDNIIDTVARKDINIYEHLSSTNVPPKITSVIASHYQEIVDEMYGALNEKDEQLVEGYSSFTKKQLKDEISFFEKVVEDISRLGSNIKKMRGPRKQRKKKVISVDKKLKLFKYKVEENSLKIKSIHPSDILGSQEVWLLNVAQKQLTVLRASGPEGLDIKRSSVIKFDPTKSTTKRCGRNLSDTLKDILNGGKVALRRVMDDISSQPLECVDRVTSNTVILRAVK